MSEASSEPVAPNESNEAPVHEGSRGPEDMEHDGAYVKVAGAAASSAAEEDGYDSDKDAKKVLDSMK